MAFRTMQSYQLNQADTGMFYGESADTLALKVKGTTVLSATTAALTLGVALALGGHLTPSADDTYDLGSASAQWRNAYIDGTAFVDKLQLGDTAIAGLVGGAGTSATPYELGATAGTALDFRFRGSHTTGDMRGMYLRLDLNAAAVATHGGEALRAFTEIENVDVAVGGTVNAIHATMEIDGDSGTVDGAGNVIRATLGGSGTKTMTGTLSGVLVDMDLPSTVTLLGTEAAVRIGKVQDHEWPVAFAFDGTVGTGNAVEAATSAMSTNATAWAIHIQVDGADGYIPVYDNKTWA